MLFHYHLQRFRMSNSRTRMQCDIFKKLYYLLICLRIRLLKLSYNGFSFVVNSILYVIESQGKNGVLVGCCSK